MSCGPAGGKECGRPDFGSCTTLSEMVDMFFAERGEREADETAWYGDPELSFEDAAARAMFMLGRQDARDRHQRPFTNDELRRMGRVLVDRRSDFDGVISFRELYYRIEQTLGLRRHQNPLLVYDVASRLGWRLSLRPEDVWLHAGPKAGADALRAGLGRPRYRPLADFPTSISTRLSAAQAEDFLCLAGPYLGPHLWD